jgi:hypothetical protein
MSHNIKAVSVFMRYLLVSTLLLFSIIYHIPLTHLIIIILIYLFWAYRKIYTEFGDWKLSLWGPVLQIASDLSVMRGFVSGIISN